MIGLTYFIFLGSIISVDDDCSHGLKRCFLLGGKAMKKLRSILKSRVITFSDNDYIFKVWFFQLSCKDMSVVP